MDLRGMPPAVAEVYVLTGGRRGRAWQGRGALAAFGNSELPLGWVWQRDEGVRAARAVQPCSPSGSILGPAAPPPLQSCRRCSDCARRGVSSPRTSSSSCRLTTGQRCVCGARRAVARRAAWAEPCLPLLPGACPACSMEHLCSPSPRHLRTPCRPLAATAGLHALAPVARGLRADRSCCGSEQVCCTCGLLRGVSTDWVAPPQMWEREEERISRQRRQRIGAAALGPAAASRQL